MQAAFEVQKTSRNILLKFLESYSLEQLNKIPEGYNNNIIWNIGHIIASQQGLVYKLSGLPALVSEDFINRIKLLEEQYPNLKALSKKYSLDLIINQI